MTREEARQAIRQRIACTDYLDKSKSGLYCCPFCGSGTGSNGTGALKHYPETNTFTCHACKKSGDVLDLIQNYSGTDYNGALQIAADSIGLIIDHHRSTLDPAEDFLPLDDVGAANKEKASPEPQEPPQRADFTEYYRECIARLKAPEGAQGVSYLNGRGISTATATALHIGFDPAADPANAPGNMTGKKYPAPRIIAPTSKAHYVGRAIEPGNPLQKANPSRERGAGAPGIFNKAALYSNTGAVFVTEGIFDAMSVCEMGRAAIATNSKSNSKALITALEKKPADPETVFIICPDNDTGKTAADTMKTAQELRSSLERLNYTALLFNIAGSYKDANEALRGNREDFGKMIEAAEQAAEREKNRDFLTDFLEKIQTEAYKPYHTGLDFFDNLLGGGVIPQSLLILMAAPGAGKTTLCQQIAEAMALHRKPIVYINLEMSREQMLAKAISGRLAAHGCTKTALQVLQGYNWTPEERQAITTEIQEYRRTIYPFMQYNPESVTGDLDGILEYLTATGERAKAAGQQAPAVIIDYLHLISTSKGLDNQELIKQAVKGLKDYAIRYNSFVIAISATNRAANSTGNITLESGRDSSNLEYTADYQLSINYAALEGVTGAEAKAKALATAQQQHYREMSIKVLKGRFVTPGVSKTVWFCPAANTFYSEEEYRTQLYADFLETGEEQQNQPEQEPQQPPRAATKRR